MARTFIQVDDRFDLFSASLERGIQRGLRQAALISAGASRRAPTRYRIGAILSAVRIDRVRRAVYKGRDGYEIAIAANDWRAILFEKGTYTRRRGKLKQPRRSSRANKGVRAIRFLRIGLAAGNIRLVDEIRRALS